MEFFHKECGPEVQGPIVSRDIDYYGTRKIVMEAARLLNGTARVAEFDDNAPNSGVIIYRDRSGHERMLDIMGSVHGIKSDDLLRHAITIDLLDEHGNETSSFRVMNPVHCFESRAKNVASLAGYRSAHHRSQLAIAPVVVRAFLRELLLANPARATLRYIEKVFDLCGDKLIGKHLGIPRAQAFAKAIPIDDERLPATFRNTRYPQQIAFLEAIDRRLPPTVVG